MQKADRDASGSLEHVRAPLPSHIVTKALDVAVGMAPHSASFTVKQQELFRSLCFVVLNFVLFTRGDTGTSLTPDRLILDAEGIHVMPLKEKGKGHVLDARLVTIPKGGIPALWQLLSDYKAWYSSLKFGTAKRTVTMSVWRLPHEIGGKWPASLADTWLQIVMTHLQHSPPAGLKWTGHSMPPAPSLFSFSMELGNI